MIKTVNLMNVHNEPADVREALAFYAAFGVIPTQYTAEERERHYAVLERVGYIEKVGSSHDVSISG